jgi:hypothetical protein
MIKNKSGFLSAPFLSTPGFGSNLSLKEARKSPRGGDKENMETNLHHE